MRDISTHLDGSFITLREPYNNQRPRCDIAWLHVTNQLYRAYGFPESRGINITYTKYYVECC